jgi:hypothetical protein
MTDVKNWSETAAENSGVSPDGFPELMARSGVNNSAREVMRAAIYFYRNAEWITVYSTTGDAWVASKADNDTLLLAPIDSQTTDIQSRFPVGTRIRMSGGVTPYVYGFVSSVGFDTPDTVVNVTTDDGADIETDTDLIEIGIVRDLLEKTAYYPTGVTLAQTPPQVPTIDDLGDGVTKDMGTGNEFDADTVDGQHYEDIITNAAGGGRSAVYNGEFQIWQRGTSINAGTTLGIVDINSEGMYTADRWRLHSGNRVTPKDDMVDLSRSIGSTSPTGYWSHMRMSVNDTNPGNDMFGLFQILESRDSYQFIGSSSLSLGMDVTGTIGNVRFMLLGWSGTADDATNLALTPIDDWNTPGDADGPDLVANWTKILDSGQTAITGSWVRYAEENVDISAFSSLSNIGILIYADDAFDPAQLLKLTGVTLANGPSLPAYIHVDPATEMNRCQMYYTNTFDDLIRPQNAAGELSAHLMTSINRNAAGDDNFAGVWQYPTMMRKAPAIRVFNPANDTDESFYDQRDATDILQADMTETITQRRVNWTLENEERDRIIGANITADAEF